MNIEEAVAQLQLENATPTGAGSNENKMEHAVSEQQKTKLVSFLARYGAKAPVHASYIKTVLPFLNGVHWNTFIGSCSPLVEVKIFFLFYFCLLVLYILFFGDI